jgi:iron complex transport system substrate-binding protein
VPQIENYFMPTIRFLLSLAFLLAATLPLRAEETTAPQRIVSINLCADQYLLELADDSQIAGLTRFSRDPAMSFHFERARHMPIVPVSAEAILQLDPDFVLASRYRDTNTKIMLRKFGLRVVEIGRAETVELMIEQTREVAALIGWEERGGRLASVLEELETVEATASRKSALVYQRRGYISGTGTIVAEAMRLAGIDNQAEKMGRRAVSHASLEEIVLNPPDYLIIEDISGQPRDIGSQLLRHPALTRLFSEDRIVSMSSALTVCGGPPFPAAVGTLRRAISRQ